MNNESFPTLVPTPRVGSEYLKLKDGKLVEWKSFDEKELLFEIESPTGGVSQVYRHDVEIPTANEELEFLSAKSK